MPIHILLVDDERGYVEILARRLRSRGFSTNFALSGREALDRIGAGGESVDVVVLDVRMPGMDGIETLKALKQMRPLVEVLMLTGHGTVKSAVEAVKLGARDYLMKPCSLDELVAKASAAAERKKASESGILLARMTPYISPREKKERIARALESPTD